MRSRQTAGYRLLAAFSWPSPMPKSFVIPNRAESAVRNLLSLAPELPRLKISSA
jgi:hypothetical protein